MSKTSRRDKSFNLRYGVVVLSFFLVVAFVSAAIPNRTTSPTGISSPLFNATSGGYYVKNENYTASLLGDFAAMDVVTTGKLDGGQIDVAGVNCTPAILQENEAWGNATGDTGYWWNHGLPGEPSAVFLQMAADNYTYRGEMVIPVVYDKSATQIQIALYLANNGTQITDTFTVNMTWFWHAKYDPGP